MLRIIALALLSLLCGNVESADEPAAKKDAAKAPTTETTIDKPILNGQQSANCRSQIRWAARVTLWRGEITRADFNAYQSVLDKPAAAQELTEQIAYSMAQECSATGKKPAFTPGGFLQWILDNWPAIMQMIQTLIGLFSQAELPDAPALVDSDPGPFTFCAWPAIFHPQGTCTAETCTPAPPAPPVTAAPPAETRQPVFTPRQGPFMQRGPVRRLLSRGLCRNCG